MKRVYPPSMQAVIEFRTGDPNGLHKILKTWFWRSVVLSAGLYVFSDKKSAIKNGVISASIIEAYLLYYFNKERSKRYIAKMNGKGDCGCNGKSKALPPPPVQTQAQPLDYMPSTGMASGFPQDMVSTHQAAI